MKVKDKDRKKILKKFKKKITIYWNDESLLYDLGKKPITIAEVISILSKTIVRLVTQ